MLEKEDVQKALDKFAKEVIARARADMPKASGRGERSFDSDTQAYPNSIQLEISADPHVEFQDKGVKGIKGGSSIAGYKYTNKMPPPSAFDRWAIRRGLAPRTPGGQFLSRKSLQFALAMHIYQYGIEPKLFFTNAVKKEIKNLPDELVVAYGLTVEKLMKLTLDSHDTN